MKTLFLSPTAQTQLNALKAANAAPLQRLDARKSVVERQRSAIEGVKTEAAQLKSSLQALASGGAPSKDAVASFVKEYNELFDRLKSVTARNAALSTTAEMRFARSDLRAPFASADVLSALRDAGVTTTRDGLAATGSPSEGFSAQALAAAIQSALERVERNVGSAERRVQGVLERIAWDRERAQLQVERANTRTEQMYMKMYEAMQRMNAANAASSQFSMFA